MASLKQAVPKLPKGVGTLRVAQPVLDEQLAELTYLAGLRRMDWLVELAKCPALLTLIRDYTTPFEKARAVGELFQTILEDAYSDLKESRASAEDKYAMAASQVLAGGALLGLVTEWPSEGNASNPLNMRWRTPRSASKGVRRQIAAAWIGSNSERTMALDRRGEACLRAFHARLFTYPKADTEVAPPLQPSAPKEPVAEEQPTIAEDRSQRLIINQVQLPAESLLVDRSLLHVIRTLEVLAEHMEVAAPVEKVLGQYRDWHHSMPESDAREIVSVLNNVCERYLDRSLGDLTGSIRVKAEAPEYPPQRQIPWCHYESDDSLVLIPGGTDPFTGQDVAPFYLASLAVTAYEWHDFLGKFGWPGTRTWNEYCSIFGDNLETQKEKLGRFPALGMTYYDCVAYCFWLWATTPYRFRLPTEAEWNFAATAGKPHRFPWGDEVSDKKGWFSTTHPKASQTPTFVDADWSMSPYKVSGLAGNAWEYTSTLWRREDPVPDSDIVIPDLPFAFACRHWWKSDRRINVAENWSEDVKFLIRGGSFGSTPDDAAMDKRYYSSFYNYGAYGGFRLAVSIDPGSKEPMPEASPLLNSHLQEVRLVSSRDFAGQLELGRFARACGSIAVFGDPAIPGPDADSSWDQLLRMRHG